MKYAITAAVTAAITAALFGGMALAYEGSQKPAARLECSSAMPDSEADFSDMYEIDAKESVRLYCKINPQAAR